jgi:hypothetical protein
MQFIELEAFCAPRIRQRFERHVEADLVSESKTVSNRASEAVDANGLPLDSVLSMPRSNTAAEMFTTRSGGADTRGTRVPRGTAIQTSAGSCVPMSWNLRAEIRQITDGATAAVAIARSWCSVVRVLFGSRYRPWPTFSRTPDFVIRVSVLV